VFALVARHPLLPAVATWMWAGVSYAGVPLLAMGVLDLGPRHHSEINPFLGALWETTGLQGVLLMGLTTLGVAAFAGPVLDIALSQDESDDFGALSPSRWVLERTQRVAWLWLIAAVVTTVLLWPLDLGFWMFEGLWWSIALAVLSALQTATSVVLLTNGIDWLHGLGRRGAVRTAEAMRRGLLEHTDVGDDPIYWRDHQFGSPTARIVGGFSAVGLLGITGVTALSSLREAHDIIPPLGFVAAVITGLLPGVACAVEETRTGSWSLLATTTITPIRLVLGKLKATARAALPMLLLSLGLWAVLRGLYTPHSTWSTCEVTLPDKGDMGRMLWTGLWVLLQPLWLSALALWVSLRGGTRWAWPVVVVAVLACIGGPVQLRHTGMGPLMELLVPFLFHEVWSCAPRRLPPELLASTMLYGAFLVLFGALAARNLRAH
jgi:hypothetical protein